MSRMNGKKTHIHTRRQVTRHLTSSEANQCQNGSSNFLTSYREEPQPTRTVLVYPRSVLSAKERNNYTPCRYDNQTQFSQGHTSCRNKGNCSTEVQGSGCLERVNLARDPASSHPKPRASLNNAPRILPVCSSLLAFVGREQTT